DVRASAPWTPQHVRRRLTDLRLRLPANDLRRDSIQPGNVDPRIPQSFSQQRLGLQSLHLRLQLVRQVRRESRQQNARIACTGCRTSLPLQTHRTVDKDASLPRPRTAGQPERPVVVALRPSALLRMEEDAPSREAAILDRRTQLLLSLDDREAELRRLRVETCDERVLL